MIGQLLRRSHWVADCHCTLISDSSATIFVTLPGLGREIPSLFILEIRVVLGSPNRTAAPSGPPIIQPVSSNDRKIKDLVQSLNVPDPELRVFAGVLNRGVVSNRGSGLGSTSLFDRMTARSIRF